MNGLNYGDTFKGQNFKKIPNDVNFNDWFDGSGLKTWWD